MPHVNTFRIARRLAGQEVIIRAHYIERLGLYGLDISCNGEPWNVRQSDNRC